MMKEHYIQGLNSRGFHRLHYTDWGNPANPRVVICVHGLTRQCRDFDALAAALQNELRVVAVSIAGRGMSDWLPNAEDYSYPQYMADMTALIARLTATGSHDISWVGTSMGGMLGMLLAARPETPIQRLVLNDIGTVVPKESMARIGKYAGMDPRFESYAEIEQYVRTVSEPFGPLTDLQWQHMTRYNTKQHDDSRWGMNYDPAIALPFRKAVDRDIVLWNYYDAISCPVLLLRGEQSDVLPHANAVEMTQRGPRPRLIKFSGIGHAPALMADDQIAAVREFLLSS